MSRKLSIGLLAVLALVAVAIILTFPALMVDNNEEQSSRQTTIEAVFATNSQVAVALGGTITAKAGGQNSDQNVSLQETSQRLVIKNAVLQIVVDKPQDVAATVSKMADEMGGWVVTSSTSQARLRSGETAIEAKITIRVLAEHLTDALHRIKASAVSVESENVSGQDVTQDYVDTVSRVTNLEAAEAQLRKIMDNATKTEDVLAVYDQLVRVRGDIEQAKGRMQYYKQAAAYSSIDLTLIPNEEDKPLEVAGWRPLDTVKSAFGTLINVVQFLISVLIWLGIVILPFVVVLGVPGGLLWRANRRRQRARRAALDAVFESASQPPEQQSGR